MVISHADNAAVSDVGQTCIVAGAVGVGVISWYLKQMGSSFTRDAGTKCALAEKEYSKSSKTNQIVRKVCNPRLFRGHEKVPSGGRV